MKRTIIDFAAYSDDNIVIFSLPDQPQGLWWGYSFLGAFDAC